MTHIFASSRACSYQVANAAGAATSLPNLMSFRFFNAIGVCAVALACGVQAENLPLDHPTAAVATKYLEAVVEQDWKAASTMLLPASLERRKTQMVNAVKNSPTMTEEAAKLSLLGVKDIRDLDKMSPQEAYIADREAVHKRMKLSEEALKKKRETLKINVLGVISESEGNIVHVLVRTKQNTIVPDAKGSGEVSIEELLLISMVQDIEEKGKWLVVPDMQTPITTPLNAAAPAAK